MYGTMQNKLTKYSRYNFVDPVFYARSGAVSALAMLSMHTRLSIRGYWHLRVDDLAMRD